MINGSKEIFAIEYETDGTKLGFVRLWINGFPIGLWEETYVFPVAMSLERVKDYSEYLELDSNKYSGKEIYEFILANGEEFDGTLLGFGESFDHFEIRAYLYKGNMVFVWRIFSLPVDEQINIRYNSFEIYVATIDQKYFSSVVLNFKSSVIKTSLS